MSTDLKFCWTVVFGSNKHDKTRATYITLLAILQQFYCWFEKRFFATDGKKWDICKISNFDLLLKQRELNVMKIFLHTMTYKSSINQYSNSMICLHWFKVESKIAILASLAANFFVFLKPSGRFFCFFCIFFFLAVSFFVCFYISL